MKDNYFRLFEECYLIDGENGAAIYNLLTGDIFSFKREEAEFLSRLENNQCIDDIVRIVPGAKDMVDNLLAKLIDTQLGTFYNGPVHIEKVTKESNWADKLFFRMPPNLHRAFIEISTECHNNCHYCGSSTVIRRQACMSCNKWDTKREIMPLNNVFQVIENLKFLDCEKLYFTGGDVFLDWGRTKEILSKAAKLGFKDTTVIWGGHSLPNEILELLASLDITLLIQRYIGPSTNIDSSADPFLRELKFCDSTLKLKYAFLLVSEYGNKELVQQAELHLSNLLKPKYILMDFMLNGREHLSREYMSEVNSIPRTSVDSFAIRRKYNPCLGGTLAITADGCVLPCPRLRDYEIGKSSELLNIFVSGEVDKYWRLTKEKVNGCSYCQYRFACNDCRFLELTLSKQLLGMGSCEIALELAATTEGCK